MFRDDNDRCGSNHNGDCLDQELIGTPCKAENCPLLKRLNLRPGDIDPKWLGERLINISFKTKKGNLVEISV